MFSMLFALTLLITGTNLISQQRIMASPGGFLINFPEIPKTGARSLQQQVIAAAQTQRDHEQRLHTIEIRLPQIDSITRDVGRNHGQRLYDIEMKLLELPNLARNLENANESIETLTRDLKIAKGNLVTLFRDAQLAKSARQRSARNNNTGYAKNLTEPIHK